MFGKRRRQRLWGRDFDVVKRGLAPDQVVAFVEDLLERYGDLLEEQRYRDTLRNLAESKVQEAVGIAQTILEDARLRAARELGPLAVVTNDAQHEPRVGQAAGSRILNLG